MPARLTLCALLCLIPTAPALARGERAAVMLFDRLDADGSGEVSLTELAEARARQFDRVDGNADGRVTLAELQAAQDRMAQRADLPSGAPEARLARQDTDGDGALTRAEFAALPPFLTLIDADGNGAISRAEFDRALTVLSRSQ